MDLYGNWNRMVSDWRVKQPDLHKENEARVVTQRDYLRDQFEEIKTAMDRQKEQESAFALHKKALKTPLQTPTTENEEHYSGHVTQPGLDKEQEETSKEESLRKAVSEMSMEELEEIVNAKKRGRPKNDDKELRQLSKQELNRKKSAKQKADK